MPSLDDIGVKVAHTPKPFPRAWVLRGGRRRWRAYVAVVSWTTVPSDLPVPWVEMGGDIPEHVGDAWTKRGARRLADRELQRRTGRDSSHGNGLVTYPARKSTAPPPPSTSREEGH